MNDEVAVYEAFFKEGLRRCMADEEPADMHAWAVQKLSRMGGGDDSALMTWPESFDFTDALLAQLEANAKLPEEERRLFNFPWEPWNHLIEPLEAGMLMSVTAPDGQGKTIYAECMSEHWAKSRHAVVFVHYELNRRLMMLRRLARHARITYGVLKSGLLTYEQKRLVAAVRPRLLEWEGHISYLHTPDWTMERTVAELRKLHAEGRCDVVVLDYLEKNSASSRQLKLYGSNVYQREADNVEQIKNFAETSEIPVLMLTQMSKAGKNQNAANMDRTDVRGAGEKSDKSNVVVLIHRDKEEGGYSNKVSVRVDKNTVGATGTFTQYMEPEFFTVGDYTTEGATR